MRPGRHECDDHSIAGLGTSRSRLDWPFWEFLGLSVRRHPAKVPPPSCNRPALLTRSCPGYPSTQMAMCSACGRVGAICGPAEVVSSWQLLLPPTPGPSCWNLFLAILGSITWTPIWPSDRERTLPLPTSGGGTPQGQRKLGLSPRVTGERHGLRLQRDSTTRGKASHQNWPGGGVAHSSSYGWTNGALTRRGTSMLVGQPMAAQRGSSSRCLVGSRGPHRQISLPGLKSLAMGRIAFGAFGSASGMDRAAFT